MCNRQKIANSSSFMHKEKQITWNLAREEREKSFRPSIFKYAVSNSSANSKNSRRLFLCRLYAHPMWVSRESILITVFSNNATMVFWNPSTRIRLHTASNCLQTFGLENTRYRWFAINRAINRSYNLIWMDYSFSFRKNHIKGGFPTGYSKCTHFFIQYTSEITRNPPWRQKNITFLVVRLTTIVLLLHIIR